MKSNTYYKPLWSLLLIWMILSSEGIGVVNTIKTHRTVSQIQSLRRKEKKSTLIPSYGKSIPVVKSSNKTTSGVNHGAIALQEDSFSRSETQNAIQSWELGKETFEDDPSSASNLDHQKKSPRRAFTQLKKSQITKPTSGRINPYTKPLNRLMQTKTKTKLFFEIILLTTLILTIINYALEQLEKQIKKQTEETIRKDLKEMIDVQMAWKTIQESQCFFFKFIRFHSSANRLLLDVTGKLMLATLKNTKQNVNLRKEITTTVTEIEDIQERIETFLENRVLSSCSLNGEQLLDSFNQIAEKETEALLEKLQEVTGENFDKATSAMTQTANKLKVEVTFSSEAKFAQDTLSTVTTVGQGLSSMKDLYMENETDDLTKNGWDDNVTKGKNPIDNKTIEKGARAVSFVAKLTNISNQLTKIFTMPKDSKYRTLKIIILSISSGFSLVMTVVHTLAYLAGGKKERIQEVTEAMDDVNNKISELVMNVLEYIETDNDLSKPAKEKEEELSEIVTQKLVSGGVNLGLAIAKLTVLLVKGAVGLIFDKIMAVVDLAQNIYSYINNLMKISAAIKQRQEAKEKYLNNQLLRSHFTDIIKNNLQHERCNTLAEISAHQRHSDFQRTFLKQIFQSNQEEFSISNLDEASKQIISTFIDQVCIRDTQICLAGFNQKFLSYFKNETEINTFTRDNYYRSTRSAISSIDLAKSEADEILLIAAGYKRYIHFNRIKYKDCGFHGVTKDQCERAHCIYDHTVADGLPHCFHPSYLSIMICRGCSESTAVKDVDYVAAENINNAINSVRNQRNGTLSTYRAFNLVIDNSTVQHYLVITDAKLQRNEEYLIDFDFQPIGNTGNGFLIPGKVRNKFKGQIDYAFENKEKALEGGIYPYILKQTLHGGQLCNRREGEVVFLTRSENTVLYLAKENGQCQNRGSVTKINIKHNQNETQNMGNIYDFILPISLNHEIVKKMGFREKDSIYKRRLYNNTNSSISLNAQLTTSVLEPVFKAGNTLYDFINQKLCVESQNKNNYNRCFFSEDTVRESFDLEVPKKYLDFNLRRVPEEIEPVSRENYFGSLVEAMKSQGGKNGITLDAFNQIGLKHPTVNNGDYKTVYRFFKELTQGRGPVPRNDFYHDDFKLLIPIRFEKNCTNIGERTLVFDDEYGPKEACLKYNDELSKLVINKNDMPWLPIEEKYYIYMEEVQHSHNAGKLNKVNEGWIAHPDMSRGWNYWPRNHKRFSESEKLKGKLKGKYELTFEVYVRPSFKSGYVPLGKNECGDFFGKDPSAIIDKDFVDNNGLYKVFYGTRGGERYIYNSLFTFFNNPSHERRVKKANGENIQFRPRTITEWTELLASPAYCSNLELKFRNFFSTNYCISHYFAYNINENCKGKGKSYFFPVILSEGNKYLEFTIRYFNNAEYVFLEERKYSTKSNPIDKVFYIEIRPLEDRDSDFSIDYSEHDVKMLRNYGYRPFLVPTDIVNPWVRVGGYFIKGVRFAKDYFTAYRIWVRDDYRIDYRRKDVCDN